MVEKQIAKTLYGTYTKKFGNSPDEMTMHKLMYFLQRESFLKYSTPLFDEDFEGWKFGPVLKSVRTEFKANPSTPFRKIRTEKSSTPKLLELVDFVLERYGELAAWKLSALSHGEFSWKQSRLGLKYNDSGNHPMLKQNILVDALLEKGRRNNLQQG